MPKKVFLKPTSSDESINLVSSLLNESKSVGSNSLLTKNIKKDVIVND